MLTWSRRSRIASLPKPFCECYDDCGASTSSKIPGGCRCGEFENAANEWQWEASKYTELSWMTISADQKEVVFHPFYSCGTAIVRGNAPLEHDHHYYWEIKMLTEPYGTDIMLGIGTDKIDTSKSRYIFTSLLGKDKESYGLSYTGVLHHNDLAVLDGPGFCKGTIIGIKVDLWQGTLEFLINRKSLGISFYNLRRHPSRSLYPMISSTTAQSSMRLIYAGSWQASLLVNAAKILGASVNGDLSLPPGLKSKMKYNFWMLLPNGSCIAEEKDKDALAAKETRQKAIKPSNLNVFQVSATKRRYFETETSKKALRHCDVIAQSCDEE